MITKSNLCTISLKHETVLPSEKDDCHHTLADFGTDQIFFRINDKGENIITNQVDSFSLEAVQPYQSQ